MNLQTILGNFALILFVAMVVTGIIWFIDIFYLARQRRAAADAALKAFDERNARLTADGIKVDNTSRAAIEKALLRQPTWVEYSGSFFPVIALVFFLRSFLFEPFKIPSSSMVPTLLVGDLILVNKFTYGIRLPIIDEKIVQVNDPQRGDVMVFKYPEDPSQNYIKRVVGVPGDKIVYENKRLTINGKALSYQPMDDYLDEERPVYTKQFLENLNGVQHRILNDDSRHNVDLAQRHNFPHMENCTYTYERVTCIVPQGNYFMMGDNRDNSLDSRYWGFVPDKNIVGKAVMVWMNLSNPRRIGGIH
ncbi:MAG: signal peptidase I [Telluria sp.]